MITVKILGLQLVLHEVLVEFVAMTETVRTEGNDRTGGRHNGTKEELSAVEAVLARSLGRGSNLHFGREVRRPVGIEVADIGFDLFGPIVPGRRKTKIGALQEVVAVLLNDARTFGLDIRELGTVIVGNVPVDAAEDFLIFDRWNACE